jgi:hypothetical protein
MARGIVALDQAIALKESELNLLQNGLEPPSPELSQIRRYVGNQQPSTSN